MGDLAAAGGGGGGWLVAVDLLGPCTYLLIFLLADLCWLIFCVFRGTIRATNLIFTHSIATQTTKIGQLVTRRMLSSAAPPIQDNNQLMLTGWGGGDKREGQFGGIEPQKRVKVN